MLSTNLKAATLLAFAATTLFGFIYAEIAGSKDLFRCRQSCYQKFVQDWHHCMDFEDCKNMCITPPNINSYIPEAFSFLCWNNCDQQLGPFPLNINSALRQGSLVLTDIGWDQAITNASKQCLVTWEVSGGGLMGNLLTDSSTVELSLWLDTVYHVQVTCKHKETGGMRRSYKLIVDTHKLSDSIATSMQAIALDTGISKTIPNIYANDGGSGGEHATSAETDSRMRILKDSSKDFLTPYNPNAEQTTSTKQQTTSSSTTTTTTTRTADPSSSTSTNSNQKVASTKVQVTLPEVEDHLNAVLRTKLTAPLPSLNLESQQFLTQSVVFAAVGSVVLFLGLVVLYLLTRTARKDVALLAHDANAAIDKEVLIRNEMLPSQTPAAHAQTQTPAAQPQAYAHTHTQTQTTSTHIIGMTGAAGAADARTLHV